MLRLTGGRYARNLAKSLEQLIIAHEKPGGADEGVARGAALGARAILKPKPKQRPEPKPVKDPAQMEFDW